LLTYGVRGHERATQEVRIADGTESDDTSYSGISDKRWDILRRATAARRIEVKRWEPCRPGELLLRQPAGSSSYCLPVLSDCLLVFALAER